MCCIDKNGKVYKENSREYDRATAQAALSGQGYIKVTRDSIKRISLLIYLKN